MKRILFLALLTLLFSQALQAQHPNGRKTKYNHADSLRGALRPERTCFDVIYYNLNLKIDISKKYIKGFNEIHFKAVESVKRIQLDLYENMEIEKILYQDQTLTFKREGEAIWIDFPVEIPKNELASVRVYYAGKPSVNTGTYSDHGFHWDTDENNRPWIGVSCEYSGASLWWPNKDHLSDEPDSVRIHLTVPNKLVCISNGKLEKRESTEEKYDTWHWFVNNPINNYNVSFYLGHYVKYEMDYITQESKEKKRIEFYCLDYEESKAKEFLQYYHKILGFFEVIYGTYPFWNDKFSIVQSSYRGMEHQGCLAIGQDLNSNDNWYYANLYPWNSTLIHETAHEWWGNSVSASDMADVWLHEAFATYSEFLFIEWMYGKGAYQKTIDYMKEQITSGPVVGNRDVNDNMFHNGNIYFKGAWVLHQLREKINNDVSFLKVLKNFQARFRKKTVCTQDFINVVNEVTKQDYTQFFKDKLYK